MGHARLKTTLIYLQAAQTDSSRGFSPLDKLYESQQKPNLKMKSQSMLGNLNVYANADLYERKTESLDSQDTVAVQGKLFY